MSNPVAVYEFDGNMTDSLGFGGVLSNLKGYQVGKLGDGVPWGIYANDGVHAFDHLLSGTGAVCLWHEVTQASINGGENMLQYLQENGEKSLSLEIESTGTLIRVLGGYGMPGAGRVSREIGLSPGWHHFAWVMSGGNMTIYVNGLQVGSPEAFTYFTTPGLVGQSENLGMNYGVTDQLCIFVDPPSQADIQHIYNAGDGRPHTEFVTEEPPADPCCDNPNRAAEGVMGDEVILSPPACSLWVNTTGNLHVITAGGDDVTLFVQAGTEVKLQVVQVREDSTASVVAFWKE